MGRHISRIGNYYFEMGDYVWDYLKQSKPKEYYESEMFDATITDVRTKEEIDVKVPVLDLVDIKLKKKFYKWKHKDDDYSIARFLFKWIQERKESVLGHPVGIIYKNGDAFKWHLYTITWDIPDPGVTSGNTPDGSGIKFEEQILKQEKPDEPVEFKSLDDIIAFENKGFQIDWE